MSLLDVRDVVPPRGFPRVSGDEPGLMPAPDVIITFSPRERG